MSMYPQKVMEYGVLKVTDKKRAWSGSVYQRYGSRIRILPKCHGSSATPEWPLQRSPIIWLHSINRMLLQHSQITRVHHLEEQLQRLQFVTLQGATTLCDATALTNRACYVHLPEWMSKHPRINWWQCAPTYGGCYSAHKSSRGSKHHLEGLLPRLQSSVAMYTCPSGCYRALRKS